MKRIILLALCFFMICTCTVMAAAEDGVYENAGQLYEVWTSRRCVPDYISGVWSTDGGVQNLTFGVVRGETGEKGKQEILALVKDDNTVTIVYQKYSRKYLYGIQEAVVNAYFDKGLGLVTAGLHEYENKIYFEVHIDFANNAETLAMIQKVTGQYGDAVAFQYVEIWPQFTVGTPKPTSPMIGITKPQKQLMLLEFVFVSSTAVLIFLFFVEMHRRRVAVVATDGERLETDALPVRRRELEAVIRKAEVTPSASLDDRVMRSIQSNTMQDS